MLKKILYNKFKIINIPERLNLSSEEFMKILFDIKNVIMFAYNKELRLLGYSGFELDAYGRATKWQPIPFASGEVYNIKDKDTAVKYQENVLANNVGFSSYSYITNDIDNYIEILNMLDNAVLINSRQIHLPFIARIGGTNNAQNLRIFFTKLFGKEYNNLIVEEKITDNNGATIEPTNMQVFLQQIQDTKKKILDEAFFYLGVSSPQGKLAHQSELEIQSASAVVDLLDKIMYDKIQDFLNACNKKFNLQMQLVKKI